MREPEVGRDVPSSFHKDVSIVDSNLHTAMTVWLKKHGKAIRPKLSREQKGQMLECFELMDQDGSGAIDADELGAAFKLLGIRMKKSEMEQLVAEVDHDGSGEVEYEEFLEIMTTTLQRLADEAEEANRTQGQVPFALMATAYRRKRLMEGIIKGDKEVQAQITEISKKASSEEEARRTEAARLAAKKANLPEVRPPSAHRPSHSGRHMERGMLSTLPRDERRAVVALGRTTSLTPLPRTSRPLSGKYRSGDWAQSVQHRQLMAMPELIDVRLARSCIKLPAALVSSRRESGVPTSFGAMMLSYSNPTLRPPESPGGGGSGGHGGGGGSPQASPRSSTLHGLLSPRVILGDIPHHHSPHPSPRGGAGGGVGEHTPHSPRPLGGRPVSAATRHFPPNGPYDHTLTSVGPSEWVIAAMPPHRSQ